MTVRNQEHRCPGCNNTIGPFAKECRHCGIAITKYYKTTNTTTKVPSNVNKRERHSISQPDITYLGEVDSFTKETLVENYNILSAKLKVSPKVIVHPRGVSLETHFAGFYYSNGVIEVVDNYLLISCLAHEMRHMYQQEHRPEMYYSTHVTNAKEYINCECERDARKFSMDYCKERGYLEELDYLIEQERVYNLFLKGVYSAADINLDDDYFRRNPIYPQEIAYAQNIQGNMTRPSYQSDASYTESRFRIEGSTIVGLIIIGACIYGLYLFLTGGV